MHKKLVWLGIVTVVAGGALAWALGVGPVVLHIAEVYWIQATTPARVNRNNASELEVEGDRIVAALVGHRERHGAYPGSLADLPQLPAGWGDWAYELDPDGECLLSIGVYRVHYFQLTWSSGKGSWYLDT